MPSSSLPKSLQEVPHNYAVFYHYVGPGITSDMEAARETLAPTRLDQGVDLLANSGLLFTAQPEAPAFVLAGASGWAVDKNLHDVTKNA